MTLLKFLPLTMCFLLGCSSQPSQPQKPTPTTRSSPTDAQAIEMERQREKQTPCSAEWLKTATDAQKNNCLQQNSINQMNALSARPPSAKKTTAGASDNKR